MTFFYDEDSRIRDREIRGMNEERRQGGQEYRQEHQ